MKPGFYPNISEERYHADNLLDVPTLNNSVAKIVLDQSPLHGWTAHPRLNPDFEPEFSTTFDIGKACHALIAGGEASIVEIDADDYRTKVAREARDEAREAVLIPVLAKDRPSLDAMHEALWDGLKDFCGFSFAFQGGVHEGTAIWLEDDIHCRCRFDWIDPNGEEIIIDYKTVSGSAQPEAFQRQIFNLGYDVQAGFYRRGAKAVLGWKNPQFVFVVQETSPPYDMSLVALDPTAEDYADRKAAEAIRIWQECTRLNFWPGYRRRLAHAQAPAWTQMRWDSHEDEERHGVSILQQAYEMQRPQGRS